MTRYCYYDIILLYSKYKKKGSENEALNNPILGGIYMVYFKEDGHIQGGWRPAIITQNIVGNCHAPIVIAIPLTGAEHNKSKIPTHVFLDAKECGLLKDSIALCEQQQPRNKSDIGKFITKLPDFYMKKLAIAAAISTPLMAYLDDASILNLIKYLRYKNNINEYDLQSVAT